MELVFKRAGGEIRLTEKEVLKIYKDSRATLIEETKMEEDIAMFIVNHTRLAKLSEGFPGEDLTLGHISVGPHPMSHCMSCAIFPNCITYIPVQELNWSMRRSTPWGRSRRKYIMRLGR
jgi:hypothetical protein